MAVELKVPEVGESITEVQIGTWHKAEGDAVERDEVIVEIETDKATLEVPAPTDGRIEKVLKQTGEDAKVGDVIAVLAEGKPAGAQKGTRKGRKQEKEQEKEAPAQAEEGEGKAGEEEEEGEEEKGKEREATQEGARKPKEPAEGKGKPKGREAEEREEKEEKEEKEEDEKEEEEEEAEEREDRPTEDSAEEPVEGTPEEPEAGPRGRAARDAQGARPPRISPAARRLLHEKGIRPEQVGGTGPEGRLDKGDVLRHLEREPSGDEPALRGVRRIRMSPMRRTIARRLVEAQRQAALLTTFNEIDMTAVLGLRREHGEAFLERHGAKLGFMGFFVKAAVEALGVFPGLNAEVEGEDVLYYQHCDVGIAIGGGKGLVVPVLRNADLLSFAEIEHRIADLAERARKNRLRLEELEGGTFTISNGGVYGSLLSTPIVNPPQSGVLGMHAIQDRPVVRGDEVVVRPMMYVALTYDHRVVDGREAVTFLGRVKEVVESPARLLLDV